jgi:hypothetical protein
MAVQFHEQLPLMFHYFEVNGLKIIGLAFIPCAGIFNFKVEQFQVNFKPCPQVLQVFIVLPVFPIGVFRVLKRLLKMLYLNN